MATWPPATLRVRLALWYLLVCSVVFTLFSGIVFLQVRSSLLQGVDDVLRARADTVRGQLIVRAQGIHYENVDAPSAQADIAVYLFSPNGTVQDRIAGSQSLPPQPRLLQRATPGYVTQDDTRVYILPITHESEQTQAMIEVMTSLHPVNSQIAHLVALLLVLTPAMLAGATVGGLVLSGRTLAPLHTITRTAQAIRAGNLAGRLGLESRDDEVGRLAATFDDMLDRLERAFEQQRRFTADASHEMRTPLTIIKGDLEVFLRRRRTVEEYEEAMRDVMVEAEYLTRLVDDLLVLARADSGQGEIGHELVYWDAVVDDLLPGLRRLAEQRGLYLDTILDRDVALVGDSGRLRQLVLNLVGNALIYTPTGGRVRLHLSRAGEQAQLQVSDTGIGIDPADLPHIFDRFYRADRARTRSAGGTGLGLAIARWCAEAHGGQITVQSCLGEGSVFTVLLPLAAVDADEMSEQFDEERPTP